MASFKENYKYIDGVIPSWLEIRSAEGLLKTPEPRELQPFLDWTQHNSPTLSILPLLTDNATEDEAIVVSALKSEASRTTLLGSLAAFIKDNKCDGLVLDFTKLPSSSYGDFISFIKEAAATLREGNRKLIVTVPLDDPSFDYETVSESADHMILRLHDEHSEAGPLAGQAWFENILDVRLKKMDGSKFIVTIGSYGLDWPEKGRAREISTHEAWQLLKASQSPFRFEPISLNPTFSYRNTENGEEHTVWFLDAVTAFNQTLSTLAMDVHGIALWKLGYEDPSVWEFFRRGRLPDDSSRKELEQFKAGYDIFYRGDGELLRVTGQENPGSRIIKLDPDSNLIMNEEIAAIPEGLTITRWGANSGKKLAITFDDGPDAKYTPRILDILAEKGVKATFFVIGANASYHPSILVRIFQEGHDIGSHTYTHPHFNAIGKTQQELELNATQRLFEAVLGIDTLLFRPPYDDDIEPQAADHAQSLIRVSAAGYTTVNMRIDPDDWANPTKAQIVDRTVSQAMRGLGNIILLHDGGGSRVPTIEALPEMIDKLRAEGFEFVTVHELLGLSRQSVMPLAQTNEIAVRKLNAVSFGIIDQMRSLMTWLFFLGLFLSIGRLILIGSLAVYHAHRCKARKPAGWLPKGIAVIVPAYNEHEVVCKTVYSLLASTIQSFEIIVVDDGSKDNTLSAVQQAFSGNGRVRILSKTNGGKSSALNLGIRSTDAEVVVALDADTILEPDAIEKLVSHFEDPAVGAVAGKVIVGNKVNLLTEIQALEYVVSQNFDRRALEIVNGVTVVPGAIGAWRREALLAIGGIPANTLAEDADATIGLECQGWKIVVESNAVARTEAPETVRAFIKQRFRWMFGMLQVAYKHRLELGKRQARGVACFAIPNIVLFQFLLVAISPVMDIALLWKLLTALTSYTETAARDLNEVFTYWFTLQILELGGIAVALRLDNSKIEWRLVPLVLVQRFGYRQLLAWIAIMTATSIIKGQLVGWGKLARTGNVTLIAPPQATQGS